jgi:hypothetical protein
MITSQEENRVREVNFNGVKQNDDFDGKSTTIYEVAQKQVLGIFWASTHFQEFQEIIILAKNLDLLNETSLPMNIAHHSERVLEENQIALILDDFIALADETNKIFLCDPPLLMKMVPQQLPIRFF